MSAVKPVNPDLLRRALRANFAFSSLSAAVLILGAGRLSPLFNLSSNLLLMGVGLSLLMFAGILFFTFSRPNIDRRLASLIITLDGLWVAGSLLLLVTLGGSITRTGVYVIAGVAVVVGLLAVLQWYGLRRSKAS